MAGNQNQTGSGSQSGGKSDRGFGSMDEDTQRDIASRGGQSVPDEERSFSKDRELASEAGKKGGQARGGSTSGSSAGRSDEDGENSETDRGGRGNFAQDPERTSKAGKKGGQQ